MKIEGVLAILLTVFTTVAVGQDKTGARLKGKVSNSRGEPVSFAHVFIDTLKSGSAADAGGLYVINKVPAGVYFVSASSLGYKKHTQKIIISDEDVTLNFILHDDVNTLDEVTVTAESINPEVQAIKESGFNVNTVETKKFENTTLDLNQLLNQTTGVRIRESGGLGSSFNFYLNGLSGNQVKFFLDGQPIENFGSVFSLHNIPANLVERIEVYKGAVPVHLGADALGGAINIVTKQKTRNFLDVSHSYGSFNTHRAALTGQYRNSSSGFTVKPQFFYNYSDNDFLLRKLKTRLTSGQDTIGNFRRFLSSYQSYSGGLELGFTNKKWADHFLAGAGYGKVNSHITGASGSRDMNGNYVLSTPGDDYFEDKSMNYNLKYAKRNVFTEGLDLTFSSAYNYQNNVNYGSTGKNFNWLGEVTRYDPQERLIFNFKQHLFQQSTGAAYALNEHHLVNFNFTTSYLERKGLYLTHLENNRLNPFNEPNSLRKSVYGLSYQNTALKEKLQTTFSLKYFDMDILTRAAKNYEYGQYTIEDLATRVKEPGYGIATRYKITDTWLLKASYEKTYRLPEAVEIFGDGSTTIANTTLIPESSNNFNFGTQYQVFTDKAYNNKITAGANGFLRIVDNMIFSNSGGRFNFYSNIPGVYIRGAEAELGYVFKDKFSIGVNATYQDVLNDIKYEPRTTLPNFVYRDRMYNTPWLFGNADAAYTFTGIGTRKLRLNVLYTLNYVNSFFLNYPSIATAGQKNTIPTQLVQNLGFTLSSDDNTYNVALECKNLANVMAFDNFAVQKPGRSFFIKIRYYLLRNHK